MAHALIKINGTDSQFTTVAIGSTVNLSNHDEGGEVSYAWQIVDQPEGTADVLSATGVENVSFTPTKEGSYLLKLTVNAALFTVSVQSAIVAVLEARTGDRIPAAAEVTETGLTGWAPAVKRILARTLHATVDANLVLAQTPGGILAGSVVRLVGSATINAGTQAAFSVAQIGAVLATGAHPERLGILIDGALPGNVSANALVLVRFFGLVPIAGTGSPAVGDAVFLSNAGVPALTAGTVSRVIGYVVASSAGSYQWVIDASTSGTPGPGSWINQQILTGTGTYSPSVGTHTARVRMIGGGGGGGGAGTGANLACGAGGGCGVYLELRISTPGTALTGGAFACGAAGTAGVSAGTSPGGTGGDTTLLIGGTTYTAKGATGGSGMVSSTTANAAGGIGQAGSSSGGSVTFSRTRRGGNAINAAGATLAGDGASSLMGTGGLGAIGVADGGAASGFGSGGGGGNTNGAAHAGGAGSAGGIIVDEYA